MKKIQFEKKHKPKDGFKSISVSNQTEDKNSVTTIKKGFEYQVELSKELEAKVEKPQVVIVKNLDTKKNIEIFQFDVKGAFYIVHDRKKYKVNFHHSLDINISWKSKIFSPKKSVVLTE